ncbi:hypothetical protein, partial [Pseudoalteromonas sp. MIP2626]|uniref:hypothetical protein n=1 Tax=Pseudoalteromonas sp. MIP2626 TaxID=2705464 RepID=UPI001C548D3C
ALKLYWFGVNTDSGKSVKSVHDKTGMSVHAKTRTGVHDGPESLFTMLRNMQECNLVNKSQFKCHISI